MTNKIQLIAILTLTSILITSGFGLTQLAYSTGSNSDKKVDYKKDDGTKHEDDDKKDDGTKHEDDDGHSGKSGTATITLFKVLTRDNSSPPYPQLDFHMKIANTTKTTEVANGTTITVDAGTYQMSETNPPGYSFVLIAGDTQCPSKLGTDFIVKGGDKIECTIYNDDDFVEGQTGGGTNGAGVIFHFDTISKIAADVPEDSPCTALDAELPCIQKTGTTYFIFPDFESDTSDNTLTQTSLILLTVLDTSDPEGNADCRVTGVKTDLQAFVAQCPNIGDIEGHEFAFNWAIIETNPAA